MYSNPWSGHTHLRLGTLVALRLPFRNFFYMVGVPEQALGGVPLGFGIVVEDKPAEFFVAHRFWIIICVGNVVGMDIACPFICVGVIDVIFIYIVFFSLVFTTSSLTAGRWTTTAVDIYLTLITLMQI